MCWACRAATDSVWAQEGSIIDTETSVTNYSLPGGCGLIFVEDNVWVEGIVNGKVTLVAANVDLAEASVHRSAILRNNINDIKSSSG